MWEYSHCIQCLHVTAMTDFPVGRGLRWVGPEFLQAGFVAKLRVLINESAAFAVSVLDQMLAF
jgi:hypothetical protein